jgi:hypothetical protein
VFTGPVAFAFGEMARVVFISNEVGDQEGLSGLGVRCVWCLLFVLIIYKQIGDHGDQRTMT